MGNCPIQSKRRRLSGASAAGTRNDRDVPDTIWAVILFDFLSITERAVLQRVSKAWSGRLQAASHEATQLTVRPREWHYPMGPVPSRRLQRVTLTVDDETGVPGPWLRRDTIQHMVIHGGPWPCSGIYSRHKPWPRLQTFHVRTKHGVVRPENIMRLNAPMLTDLCLEHIAAWEHLHVYMDSWTHWKTLQRLDLTACMQRDADWYALSTITPRLTELRIRCGASGDCERDLRFDDDTTAIVTDATTMIWTTGWQALKRFEWIVAANSHLVHWNVSASQQAALLVWTTVSIRLDSAQPVAVVVSNVV